MKDDQGWKLPHEYGIEDAAEHNEASPLYGCSFEDGNAQAASLSKPRRKTFVGVINYLDHGGQSGRFLPLTSLDPIPEPEWRHSEQRMTLRIDGDRHGRNGLLCTARQRPHEADARLATFFQYIFKIIREHDGAGGTMLHVLINDRLWRLPQDCIVEGVFPEGLSTGTCRLRWNYKTMQWMLRIYGPSEAHPPLRKPSPLLRALLSEHSFDEAYTARVRRANEMLEAEVQDDLLLRRTQRKALENLQPRDLDEAIALMDWCAAAGFAQCLDTRIYPLWSRRQFLRWISGIDPRPVLFQSQQEVDEWREIVRTISHTNRRRMLRLLRVEDAHSAAYKSLLEYDLECALGKYGEGAWYGSKNMSYQYSADFQE